MYKHFEDELIDEIKVNVENNYFSPILNHLISKYKFKNICDVGCGNGKFSSFFKTKLDCNLIGLDGSRYALKEASKLKNFDELLYVRDFSKTPLPLKSNSMDLVICKDVFEHLLIPDFLSKEINRVLKINGILLVHVPNHFPIWGRIKFLINNNIDTFNYFPKSERYNFPHIRFFTFKSFANLFINNGFFLLENISFYFFKLPILERIFPLFIKKQFCAMSSDNFSEGVTLIFIKKNVF